MRTDHWHSSVTTERVLELCEASMLDLDCVGICTACGEEQGGVEPDAENYECENCGRRRVCGVERLLLELEV